MPPIIYITGFMGSGKTTVGRKLASLKKWDFIDLDEEIEKRLRKTISEIFREEGEDQFRLAEAETLRTLNLVKETVVAVGGGAPCFHGNMDYMLQTGKVVYLKMDAPGILKRLENETEKRPLLNNIPPDLIGKFISIKIREREEYYNRAHIIADANDPEVCALVNGLTEPGNKQS